MTNKPVAVSVLAISSQVIYGPVGNSAAAPAMQKLGLNVLGLPTLLLSNHPGHGPPVRQVIGADTMKAMLDHLAGRGWLDDVAGVMTGYFVDEAQVEVAAGVIAGLKAARPGLVYLCDPILGDDEPGLYVPDEVARAIRSRLVPMADIVTPNRFELSWLADQDVTGLASAAQAARGLAPLCLATSIPLTTDRLATMLIGTAAWLIDTRRRDRAPNGAGDLLSGLFLAHTLHGRDDREALALSLGTVEAVLDASRGSEALDLAAGLAGPGVRLSVQPLEITV